MNLINEFWFAHGVIAIITQLMVALAVWLLGMSLLHAFMLGAAFTIGCYVGRERKVAEINANNRALMPWSWSHNPSVVQDVGVPTMLNLIPIIIIWVLSL